METETITIETGSDRRVFDLTSEIDQYLRTRDAHTGLLNVFIPHATAGVAIIETGAGSDADLIDAIDNLLPRDDRWRHSHGSPGHGADHVLPAFVAPSVSVPVIDTVMALGTWQSVVLVDPNADNPRRRMRLSFIPG